MDAVLYALTDSVRRGIVLKLMNNCDGMSCIDTCEGLSPSTISFHYKILRESGLIRSEKVGVEVKNTLRLDEMNKRFPGLLDAVLRNHKK